MIRHSLCSVAIVFPLVCGCGSQPAVKSQATHGQRESPTNFALSLTATDPDLEAVPEQTEPSMTDDSLPGAEAFAALVKAAAENDQDAWTKSETDLHNLGGRATAALAARLSDEDRVARELAAMFLAQLGPDASSAAGALAKLLGDESTFARVNAAAALSIVPEYTEQVIPVLQMLLSDEDANVRQTAAFSLRNVGAAAEVAIQDLTQALTDPEAQVRTAAAGTLGELGPIAQRSLPALRELATAANRDVATAATRAIRRIDGSATSAAPETIPASAFK